MARGATSTTSSVKLSRWRPTPEQLMVLQDLFMRKGVKTPTAQQIQRITQQLMQFGKVETKNVFYWFQNHKAREKQKLRKRLLNCYYYFQHGHHGEDEQQQTMSNVFYYCLPPHSPGFLPFNIPAAGQMMRTSNSSNDQVLENTPSSDRTSCSTDLNPCNGVNAAAHHDYKDRGLSPPEECVINLMNDVVVMDSTPPLKTLQLFPTTTTSRNITTTATETPTVQDPCVLASATSSPTFLSLFMSSYELDTSI